MNALTRIRNEERAWVLVVAMVVMALMLSIGLAAVALSDTQNQQSRKERERESSLNLAEGLLYTQSFILALPPSAPSGATEGWPGSAGRAYPAAGCTQTTGGLQCPDDAMLANVANTLSQPASFASADVGPGTTWITRIQDNGPANNNDYANATNTSWDANGDERLWVRATAQVRGRTRTVVGLMELEDLPVNFPRTAITAGTFTLRQNGNQTYIDTGGTSVQLRCEPATSASCADYDRDEQVTGAPGSIVSDATIGTVLSSGQTEALKQKAISLGRFYPAGTCPTGAEMQADVVYVENCTKTYQSNEVSNTFQCSYTIRSYTPVNNQRCIHGPGRDPFGGAVVWERGTLGFSSGVAFFGVIYHLNLDKCGLPTADDVVGACTYNGLNQSILVTTAGGGTILGSVNIEGTGGVEAGNNSSNIVYDPNVFNSISTSGTTGLVQNTWRELDPGQ
jgi:hypothetical protein